MSPPSFPGLQTFAWSPLKVPRVAALCRGCHGAGLAARSCASQSRRLWRWGATEGRLLTQVGMEMTSGDDYWLVVTGT